MTGCAQKCLLWVLALVAAGTPRVEAQRENFTAESELVRQLPHYPFIRLATRPLADGVLFLPNLPYTPQGLASQCADLFLPAGNAPKTELKPVLILVHGGGWRSGDKTLDHPLAHELALRGIAVVCLRYRLSTEALYPAAVLDVKAAIRWVRSMAAEYALDTARLTLGGSSAGGQLAALVGAVNGRYAPFENSWNARYASSVHRVIDIDGVVDFLHPDSKEGMDRPQKPSAASLWWGVNRNADSLHWAELAHQASASNHVHRGSADFLFLLSSQTRFSAGVIPMCAKLQACGASARVVRFPHSPHTFWLFHPWFALVADEMEAFVKHNSSP